MVQCYVFSPLASHEQLIILTKNQIKITFLFFHLQLLQTKKEMVLKPIIFAVPPTLGWGSLGDITEV